MTGTALGIRWLGERFFTRRHGPACPGHLWPHGVWTGGPDMAGHDDGRLSQAKLIGNRAKRAWRDGFGAALLLLLTAQGAPPERDQAGSVQEQTTRDQMDEAERVRALEIDTQREATEKAASALREENKLTEEQAAVFARLKQASAVVDQMTRHLADLEQSKTEAARRIAARAKLLEPLLPLMLRLSRFPAETLLASGLPAEDAIRGVVIVRSLARQAEVETRTLAADQTALETANKAAEDIMPRLASARAARTRESDVLAEKLNQVREQRQSAEHEAEDAARHAAAEAARAKNLHSMLQILVMQRRLDEAQAHEDGLRADREQQTAAGEAARLRQAALSRPAGATVLSASAKPSGQLRVPVAGVLVRGWADPEDGEAASGMSWQTDESAPVVAPCGGTVAFAEPFRGYGLLVIIDCGGTYHAVLSGLEQLSVVPGKSVQGGDAVGTMRSAARTAAIPAIPMAASGSRSGGASMASGPASAGPASAGTTQIGPPILYFELRKGGRAINPAPWLRSAG